MSFVVQGRSGSGAWKHILSGSLKTGAGGKMGVIIYYSARGIVGIHQRIHFTIGKDSAHLGNTSAWVQFRVTS